MSDRLVTCLHCDRGLMVDPMFPGTGWVHRATGADECQPTYAAPVFPGDPIWHAPLDQVSVVPGP